MMASQRAFYSVVQYCPDRFRAEAVNVGLVVLCIEPHGLRVRMTRKHDRVRKLFAVARSELKNLKLAMVGLQSRFESSADEFHTAEDLAAFAASRANDLRLTEPRLAKIESIDDDFERLYGELVADQTIETPAKTPPLEMLPTKLDEAFNRLRQAHKVWQPGEIIVPVYKRKLEIPYAYKNGVVNLVKPHLFQLGKRGEMKAAALAIDGDLISKHPIDGEQHKLIVVSTQETDEQAEEINERVAPLFKEYNVELVRPQDVDAFASEIEKSAH